MLALKEKGEQQSFILFPFNLWTVLEIVAELLRHTGQEREKHANSIVFRSNSKQTMSTCVQRKRPYTPKRAKSKVS